MSQLTDSLVPGDIINLEGWSHDRKHLLMSIASWFAVKAITAAQKSVFCRVLPPESVFWKDHHTMMYFGPDNVFSVHPPKPAWLKISEFDEADKKRTVSVYRMNPAWSGGNLTRDDLFLLNLAAQNVVDAGKAYDIGQLFDVLVDTIAGYPHCDKWKWFDCGKDNIVCSVGVAAIVNNWRHAKRRAGGREIPQPWRKLNPGAWPEKFVKNYPGYWASNNVFPAMFAVSGTHFAGEFGLVGKFKAGKRI